MTHKQFAIKIAKQAGKIMFRDFRLGMNKRIKADGSPVTKTDFAINKMVIGGVKNIFLAMMFWARKKVTVRIEANICGFAIRWTARSRFRTASRLLCFP